MTYSLYEDFQYGVPDPKEKTAIQLIRKTETNA